MVMLLFHLLFISWISCVHGTISERGIAEEAFPYIKTAVQKSFLKSVDEVTISIERDVDDFISIQIEW
jgi:hypothetical protein